MSFDAVLATPGLEARWAAALAGTKNLYAMYHSVPWLRSVESARNGQVSLLVDAAGDDPAAMVIAPLAPTVVQLKFEATRKARLSFKFHALELLGSQPVGDQSFDAFARLVDAVWAQFPDVEGLYLKSVADDSSLWSELERHEWRVGRSIVYKPDGDRPFHYVSVPATFESYMGDFPSKQRYNLKKKVRRMTEAFGGDLVARRIVAPLDLGFLVESATRISGNSWRAKELERAVPESIGNAALLERVAERGLLRAFVLLAKGVPCAFIVGYQIEGGTFHYADLAYDEAFAAHSPGTVLLLMAIENLIANDQITNLNFGITDAQYKQVFGNRHVHDAGLLILRPTLRNACLRSIHRAFRDAKDVARRAIKSKATSV